MHPSRRRDKAMNIMLTTAERAMAQELAVHLHLTISDVVRSSLRARHIMTFKNTPVCADNARCLCPALHLNIQRPDYPSPLREPDLY